MAQPKRLQIKPFRKWGWKLRAVFFVSVFNLFWLGVDSYSGFAGQNNVITALGNRGYILMVVLALIVTYIYERITINRIPTESSKVHFSVGLVDNGQNYPISVSHDLRVSNFLNEFTEKISPETEKEPMLSHLDLYEKTLLVKRGGTFVPVASDQTLREAGIRNDDNCRIRITIRQGYAERELET